MVEENKVYNNFLITKIKYIDSMKVTLILAKHKNGLELVHLLNDDNENFFSYNFATPPNDDYGSAHIVEHTLFCGSKKFPNKDNFFTMDKKSVNTFMNAMTGSDITFYPASSCLEKDYFNLLELYGDSVFNPLLEKKSFETEGVRLDLNKENKLEIAGIVYNEMKGYYSNFDNYVLQSILIELFPDTHYRFDAGGRPEEIPNLSYSQFCSFHKEHYTQTNCKMFLYGNIETEKQLKFLDEKILVNAPIGEESKKFLNQKFSEKFKYTKILAPLCSSEKNKTILLNWGVTLNSQLEALELELLSSILTSNQGSPLCSELLKLNYTTDISQLTGSYMEFMQPIVVVGVQTKNSKNYKDVKNDIIKLLENFYKNGLPKNHIESAIANFEFHKREIKSSYPLGYRFLETVVPSWFYYDAPSVPLEIIELLEIIKSNYENDEFYFSKLINKFFLENTHSTILEITPSKKFEKNFKIIEDENKQHFFAKWFDSDYNKLKVEVDRFYNEADERIDNLNQFSIEKNDLAVNFKNNMTEIFSVDGVKYYYIENENNGITYTNLYFNINDLSTSNLLNLSILSKLIFSMPHQNKTFEEVSAEAMLVTGAPYSFIVADTNFRTLKNEAYFVINTKFLDSKHIEALNYIYNCCNSLKFDTKRIKEVLINYKNNFIQSVLNNGSYFAEIYAKENVSTLNKFFQKIDGFEFYNYICKVLKSKKEFNLMIEEIKKLYNIIFTQNRLRINFCASKSNKKDIENSFYNFSNRLVKGINYSFDIFNFNLSNDHEVGVPIHSLTSYNAVCVKAYPYPSKNYYKLNVIAKILTTSVLEIVRVKFGAYGAKINVGDGYLVLSSYRDPFVRQTLEFLKKALLELKSEITETKLNEVIVKILAKNLRSLKPEEKNSRYFFRSLYEISDDCLSSALDYYQIITTSDLISLIEQMDLSDEKIFLSSIGSKRELKKAKIKKLLKLL